MNPSLSTLNCVLGQIVSQHTDSILSEETESGGYASRSPAMPSAFQGVLNSQGQTSSSLKLNFPLCIHCAHWVLGSNPLPLHCFPGSSACSNPSPHALQGCFQAEAPGRAGAAFSCAQPKSFWCLRTAGQDLLWKQGPTYFYLKTRERVSLHKGKQNKTWVNFADAVFLQ